MSETVGKWGKIVGETKVVLKDEKGDEEKEKKKQKEKEDRSETHTCVSQSCF